MPHAFRMEKTGGPEVLQWVELDPGKPGAGEVLIRNTAVGLNYIDIYVRTGLYPAPLPTGIGFEAAYAWLKYGFETAGLERIVAVCVEENVGSWRIMEKCGMTFEGLKPAYGMQCKFYAISKDEFLRETQEV